MGNPTGKGGFKKGESGNKSGRPKIVGQIQELARAHSEEAFQEIVKLSKYAEDERVRLHALKEILDRAYGRPSQELQHTGKDGSDLVPSISVSVGKVG